MNKKKEIGSLGEKLAIEYLIKKGYSIIDKNYKCNFGEIDIIAYQVKYIVFVEVKTRTNNKYGSGIQAIDIHKQEHIYNTAEFFLFENNISNFDVRIDAIEINLNNKSLIINHYLDIIKGNP